MKVLITGSSGFVGRAMTAHLVAHGHEVIPYDMVRAWGAGEPEMNLADAMSTEGLLRRVGHDAIVPFVVLHLAGNADTAAHRNTEVQVNDIVAATRVLTVCAKLDKPVVVASSAYALTRNTPYGWTKGAIEDVAMAFRDRGHPVGIMRFFNIYGPGQEAAVTYRGTVVTDLIRRFAQDGGPVAHRWEVAGSDQMRDFIFIDDAVKIIEDALREPIMSVTEVGSGYWTSIWDLAQVIAKEVGCSDRIVKMVGNGASLAGMPYNRPAKLLPGVALPFRHTALEAGIAKTVQHMLKAEETAR